MGFFPEIPKLVTPPAPSDRRKLLTSFWRMMLSASLFHCPHRIRQHRPNPFSSSIKRGELFSLFSKWITPCGSDWVSKIGGKIRQSRRHTSSNLPYSEVLGDFPCSLSTMPSVTRPLLRLPSFQSEHALPVSQVILIGQQCRLIFRKFIDAFAHNRSTRSFRCFDPGARSGPCGSCGRSHNLAG